MQITAALSVIRRPSDIDTYVKLTKFLPCCGDLPETETVPDQGVVFHRPAPAGYQIDGVKIDELVYDGSILRSAVAHGPERVWERQFGA
jgi:hypothetical protein